MKQLLLIVFLTTFNLLGYAQKVKPVEYGGGITLLKVVDVNNETFQLRVIGYGKNDALAQEDAEVRAIRMAMYVGIREYRAILSSESDAEAQHGDFLNEFFEQKQYKDYLPIVEPVGALVKVKGLKVKKKPFDITLSRGKLDAFLRSKKTKKSIGFRR